MNSAFVEAFGRNNRPSGPKGSTWPGREGNSYEVRAVHEFDLPIIDQSPVLEADQIRIPEIDLELGIEATIESAGATEPA